MPDVTQRNDPATKAKAKKRPRKKTPLYCEPCGISFLSTAAWRDHLGSLRHLVNIGEHKMSSATSQVPTGQDLALSPAEDNTQSRSTSCKPRADGYKSAATGSVSKTTRDERYCDACDIQSDTTKAWNRHQKSIRHRRMVGELPAFSIFCEECGRGCSSKRAFLYQHRSVCRGPKAAERPTQTITERGDSMDAVPQSDNGEEELDCEMRESTAWAPENDSSADESSSEVSEEE